MAQRQPQPETSFKWYARPRGPWDAPIVFVVGVPSYAEEKTGRVLPDDTYNMVMAFIQSTGLEEKECVFVCCTNYLKKGAKPKAEELHQSWDAFLGEFIGLAERTMVVAMGNDALCALQMSPKPEKVTSFRGTLTELKDGNVATATNNPFYIASNPDKGEELAFDIKCAFDKLMDNEKTEIPIEQNWLETVGDIEDMTHKMITAKKFHNVQSYDHETDNGSANDALSVLTCFANGYKNENGEYEVDVWAPYDKMQPRFSRNQMRKMNDALKEHYSMARMTKEEGHFRLMAHNRLYDDWVTSTNYFEDDLLRYFDGSEFLYLKSKKPGLTPCYSQHDPMIMSFVLDSRSPNDAKSTLHKICGYPEYDKGIRESVRAVADSRKKVLTEENLWVLRTYGYEPEVKQLKTGGVSYKWPKTVDKMICTYSMVDLEQLVKYCCFDAAGTWLSGLKMLKMIKEQGLQDAYQYRMKFAKAFIPGERRGFLLDKKANRRLSKGFGVIEESTTTNMRKYIAESTDLPKEFADEFGPSRDAQVRTVLYGKPVMVPLANQAEVLGDVMSVLGVGKKKAQAALSEFHEEFYHKFNKQTVDALKDLDEDGKAFIIKNLKKEFGKAFNIPDPEVTMTPMYIDGEIRPKVFTKTGLPSVNRLILEAYYDATPTTFVQYLLMYKKASKLKSVYVDGLLKFVDSQSIVRPHYNSIGTMTGRPSSSKPNGQNFNKYVKGQFIPRPGFKFLEVDVKQAEVFTIAAYSMDENLLRAVNAIDVHSVTASLMFGIPVENVGKDSFERRAAKTITFGLIYGMAAPRLAFNLGITEKEAAGLMEKFFKPYSDLKAWIDEQPVLARRAPYHLYTAFGTRLSCMDILSIDNEIKQHWERVAVNMPIQGTAAEYIMYCTDEINEEIVRMGWEGDAGFVNNIHDALTYEATDRLVRRTTTGAIKGPLRDLVVDTVGSKPPVAPIDIIRYKLDVELNDFWGTKPNINKAVDPKFGDFDADGNPKSIIRWDLIKCDLDNLRHSMDSAEIAEFKEIDWDRVSLY